jgi:hypothetical protein
LLNNLILGYIKEMSDGTWLAISTFTLLKLQNVEISGFASKAYAIRYLHQIAIPHHENLLKEIPIFPWEYH